VGERHPERFRCGDNSWTCERLEDGGVLFRRWEGGEEVERFVMPPARWLDAVVHLAHPAHTNPTSSRITRASIEYIHLGPRTPP
jgi:hypothetical protein